VVPFYSHRSIKVHLEIQFRKVIDEVLHVLDQFVDDRCYQQRK
jgi:hypothetical protein